MAPAVSLSCSLWCCSLTHSSDSHDGDACGKSCLRKLVRCESPGAQLWLLNLRFWGLGFAEATQVIPNVSLNLEASADRRQQVITPRVCPGRLDCQIVLTQREREMSRESWEDGSAGEGLATQS